MEIFSRGDILKNIYTKFQEFEKLYKEYLWGSYNKYSHEDTEILIEVTPKFVEVWDTSEDNYAFQIFIDFEKKAVEVKQYDK